MNVVCSDFDYDGMEDALRTALLVGDENGKKGKTSVKLPLPYNRKFVSVRGMVFGNFYSFRFFEDPKGIMRIIAKCRKIDTAHLFSYEVQQCMKVDYKVKYGVKTSAPVKYNSIRKSSKKASFHEKKT